MRAYIAEQDQNFDSEEQRRLYRLSQKLEKKIWMKKVKNDVEVLTNAWNRIGNDKF